MNWLGGNGLEATMMYGRDRLPGDIEGQYIHKNKTDSSDKTKVARFFHNVVATKKSEKVTEKITCDNGDNVEHIIIFQGLPMSTCVTSVHIILGQQNHQCRN